MPAPFYAHKQPAADRRGGKESLHRAGGIRAGAEVSAVSRMLTACLLLVSTHAYAGFDHETPLDQSGIWARGYQTGLENGVIALEVTGSLWFGNDDELGHTFWQTIDSSAISGLSATVLKYAFGRARPYQVNNPNAWFKGGSDQSF